MEGYLKHQETTIIGRRTWKTRWCILEKDLLKFYKYIDVKTDEPFHEKGCFDITQCNIKVLPPLSSSSLRTSFSSSSPSSPSSSSSFPEYSFLIYYQRKSYYFAATSELQLNKWMKAFDYVKSDITTYDQQQYNFPRGVDYKEYYSQLHIEPFNQTPHRMTQELLNTYYHNRIQEIDKEIRILRDNQQLIRVHNTNSNIQNNGIDSNNISVGDNDNVDSASVFQVQINQLEYFKSNTLHQAYKILSQKLTRDNHLQTQSLYYTIPYEVMIQKGGRGVNLGLCLVEDGFTGDILVTGVLPSIRIVSFQNISSSLSTPTTPSNTIKKNSYSKAIKDKPPNKSHYNSYNSNTSSPSSLLPTPPHFKINSIKTGDRLMKINSTDMSQYYYPLSHVAERISSNLRHPVDSIIKLTLLRRIKKSTLVQIILQKSSKVVVSNNINSDSNNGDGSYKDDEVVESSIDKEEDNDDELMSSGMILPRREYRPDSIDSIGDSDDLSECISFKITAEYLLQLSSSSSFLAPTIASTFSQPTVNSNSSCSNNNKNNFSESFIATTDDDDNSNIHTDSSNYDIHCDYESSSDEEFKESNKQSIGNNDNNNNNNNNNTSISFNNNNNNNNNKDTTLSSSSSSSSKAADNGNNNDDDDAECLSDIAQIINDSAEGSVGIVNSTSNTLDNKTLTSPAITTEMQTMMMAMIERLQRENDALKYQVVLLQQEINYDSNSNDSKNNKRNNTKSNQHIGSASNNNMVNDIKLQKFEKRLILQQIQQLVQIQLPLQSFSALPLPSPHHHHPTAAADCNSKDNISSTNSDDNKSEVYNIISNIQSKLHLHESAAVSLKTAIRLHHKRNSNRRKTLDDGDSCNKKAVVNNSVPINNFNHSNNSDNSHSSTKTSSAVVSASLETTTTHNNNVNVTTSNNQQSSLQHDHIHYHIGASLTQSSPSTSSVNKASNNTSNNSNTTTTTPFTITVINDNNSSSSSYDNNSSNNNNTCSSSKKTNPFQSKTIALSIASSPRTATAVTSAKSIEAFMTIVSVIGTKNSSSSISPPALQPPLRDTATRTVHTLSNDQDMNVSNSSHCNSLLPPTTTTSSSYTSVNVHTNTDVVTIDSIITTPPLINEAADEKITDEDEDDYDYDLVSEDNNEGGSIEDDQDTPPFIISNPPMNDNPVIQSFTNANSSTDDVNNNVIRSDSDGIDDDDEVAELLKIDMMMMSRTNTASNTYINNTTNSKKSISRKTKTKVSLIAAMTDDRDRLIENTSYSNINNNNNNNNGESNSKTLNRSTASCRNSPSSSSFQLQIPSSSSPLSESLSSSYPSSLSSSLTTTTPQPIVIVTTPSIIPVRHTYLHSQQQPSSSLLIQQSQPRKEVRSEQRPISKFQQQYLQNLQQQKDQNEQLQSQKQQQKPHHISTLQQQQSHINQNQSQPPVSVNYNNSINQNISRNTVQITTEDAVTGSGGSGTHAETNSVTRSSKQIITTGRENNSKVGEIIQPSSSISSSSSQQSLSPQTPNKLQPHLLQSPIIGFK